MIPQTFEPTVDVLALVALVTLAWNVLLYGVALALSPRDASTDRTGETPSVDVAASGATNEDARGPAGRVHCHDCGTPNESGYRYCRECLSELPGAMAFDRSGGPPAGRLIR